MMKNYYLTKQIVKMKTEEELINEIKQNLHALEIEAYGERRHSKNEMPPSVSHFLRNFKDLYQAVYDLSLIEGQSYIQEVQISMIYDVEREVEGELNYLIEKKNFKEPLIDILSVLLLKVQRNLSCISDKIKDKADNSSYKNSWGK